MIAAGWTFEGNGNTMVFACVPPSPIPDTPEGLWIGTTTTNENIYRIILDTGVYYVIYTSPGTNTIAGVVQGTFASSNGTSSSSDAKDFEIGCGVFGAMVSGAYTPRYSIAGTISSGMLSEGFNAAYQTQYDQPVDLAAAAGTFSGQVASSLGWQSAIITLDALGNLAGSSNGCTFGGTASPHGSVNIPDVIVAFNGGVCIFGTSTLSGVAYYDAIKREIFGATPNASRTDGFLFVGTKP